MKLFGGFFERKSQQDEISLNTLISRLQIAMETGSGVAVTPENCERSPTVKAIVGSVSKRIAVTPVRVKKRTFNKNGRRVLVDVPDHPLNRLFDAPNAFQSRANYWLDLTSAFVRYGNYYAWKSRGNTGPVRRIYPLDPATTDVKLQEDWSVKYTGRRDNARGTFIDDLPSENIHHLKGAARNFVKGDSPVLDLKESIGYEIAAEIYGATVFGNGAAPSILLEFSDDAKGFKDDADRDKFVEEFQEKFSRRGRQRVGLLPKGIKAGSTQIVENEKAQYLELRRHQRTVIAGGFNFPLHLVGDLEQGKFNNVEQQNLSFTQNVIMPITDVFESGMERDFLTAAERAEGYVIRFMLNEILRGDFKSRQEGLQIQRDRGIINANEWREYEGLNPREDPGGEEYYEQGPSGQTPAGSGDDDPDDPDNQDPDNQPPEDEE